MIKPIERPDRNFSDRQYDAECARQFDAWFQEYVKPLNKAIREGVEVFADNNTNRWYPETDSSCSDTHKALLINIQPIRKETAEDVLRDILETTVIDPHEMISLFASYSSRAKKVLGESE